MWAIETRGLKKVYRPLIGGTPVVAVAELNLQVPYGCVFGFLGPNGAGKTTTIQILIGNVYPTAGQAWVLGYKAGALAAKRRLGFLPEKFQFHEFLTAEEFLKLHGRLAGMDGKTLAKRIDEVLELVGLQERRKSRIREFSKGMQQRIGLAQAILHDPDLVILDEPTSALDPLGRRRVREVIEYLKQQGKTVFLNSHLLSEVERSCDMVAILNKGRVVKQGTLEALLVHKSVVVLELRQVVPSVLEALERVATKVQPLDTNRVMAEVADERAIPELARAVVYAGGELMGMQAKRETLEDLFIQLVEGEAK
ncbi:ABC-2 type transport system ATP-binding protein [Armatimonadetes bacterium GBS]|jgi:ABC-2 type transport system ATP-binding protein|nr:putative ABC transporter ATP-binding protein YxlF [bacterium HR14]GIV11896.1 MAG: multidrug ABC transporter ATP-binding protein [Fimbriimonadales bacterium]CUU11284.1 ABC-2 type transport system ATP-binding protein [Armatimonadetes bacterium GBS]CUU34553.1 ABC-2 type transport system ATP-binding protein [Armatimonadetes bacterium GXS]